MKSQQIPCWLRNSELFLRVFYKLIIGNNVLLWIMVIVILNAYVNIVHGIRGYKRVSYCQKIVFEWYKAFFFKNVSCFQN